jgi:hypothetical protein
LCYVCNAFGQIDSINMDFSNNLWTNVLSVVSLAFAGTTFYFYFRDRKREKYSIASDYCRQLMEWHGETVEILIGLRNATQDKDKKKDFLTKLSAQIEKGRFYFPNIDKGNRFGKDKPIAYQGYRNLTLDFLVYSYNLFDKDDAGQFLEHAAVFQREFTSIIFSVVRPKETLEEIKGLTDKFLAPDKIFDDYLKHAPNSIQFMKKVE